MRKRKKMTEYVNCLPDVTKGVQIVSKSLILVSLMLSVVVGFLNDY